MSREEANLQLETNCDSNSQIAGNNGSAADVSSSEPHSTKKYSREQLLNIGESLNESLKELLQQIAQPDKNALIFERFNVGRVDDCTSLQIDDRNTSKHAKLMQQNSTELNLTQFCAATRDSGNFNSLTAEHQRTNRLIPSRPVSFKNRFPTDKQSFQRNASVDLHSSNEAAPQLQRTAGFERNYSEFNEFNDCQPMSLAYIPTQSCSAGKVFDISQLANVTILSTDSRNERSHFEPCFATSSRRQSARFVRQDSVRSSFNQSSFRQQTNSRLSQARNNYRLQ